MFFFPHERIRQVWSQSNQFCFASVLFLFLFSNPDFFWELFLFRERWDFVPTLRCCIYSASGGRCLYGLTFWMNLSNIRSWSSPGPWPNQMVVKSSFRPGRVWPQGQYEDFCCPVSFSKRKKRCYIHKCQISHKLHALFSWPILQFYRIQYRLFEEKSYPESIRWAPRWSEIQRKWSTQNAGFLLKRLDMLGLRSS